MSVPEKEQNSHSSFETQRDQLLQEITAAMNSVVFNLGVLNKSIEESVEVGNDFQDASKLWGNFYDGLSPEITKGLGNKHGEQKEQVVSDAAHDSGANAETEGEIPSAEQSESVPAIESVSEQSAVNRSGSTGEVQSYLQSDVGSGQQNQTVPHTP